VYTSQYKRCRKERRKKERRGIKDCSASTKMEEREKKRAERYKELFWFLI